ncbi:NAD(P)H-dependent oxidoreductase [Paraburkholderia oxyphila]|uniref:NAD(P)H-dependent oxidoreductase n=1 Tax=Paraburkholderia oxyphila TaxID=614212 RepID=UPI0005B99BD4|nr:NAD(P)H-dependent oxidoreductase [Paraburkholderia oxyphila]
MTVVEDIARGRVLVVHAHPEPQSFTSSMFRAAQEVLLDSGHEVRTSDLYAKGFNPVASSADFETREDPEYLVYAKEQRAGRIGGTLSPDIEEEVESVLWADLVVLNFPIFWFSTPAILKGWIDRVFLSGQFYGGMRFYDRGGLKGKRAWVTATLGGRPHMFGKDAVHDEIDIMLTHLLRGTLAYVGFEVLEPFFGYHVPYISEKERAELLARFEQDVRNWQTRQTLSFRSLDEFDEHLYPLAPEQAARDRSNRRKP